MSDLALWYPITTLRWANIPVQIRGDGYQCLAMIRRHKVTRMLWWHEYVGRTLVQRWRVGLDSKERSYPNAWRPANPLRWPHELPDPIAQLLPAKDPVVSDDSVSESEPDDPVVYNDGWPYPNMVLGANRPPTTIKECEARLLRAFRTSASHSVQSDGPMRRTFCSDIPSEMVKVALKHFEADRQREGAITSDDFVAVRSGWKPDKRDITDWVYALDWLKGVSRTRQRIVALRSADPVFSYRQIALIIAPRRGGPLDAASVRHRYVQTICLAFRAAQQQEAA